MIKKVNDTTTVLLLSCFLYGILSMTGVFAMPSLSALFTKTYKYSIDVGAPLEYEMVYDFNENYFTDQAGKPLLRFTSVGGSPSMSWANGSQGTVLSAVNPLPHGIKVRWFSVAENQFWEATHQFDYVLLQQLSQYTVNNVLERRKIPFMYLFDFTVYVVPNGLVTVWASGGGETFVVAQFKARRVEEPNWENFARPSLLINKNESTISRKDYIKERFSDPSSLMSTKTKQEVETGKLPINSAPWTRLMQTYPWQLSTDNGFILKDYWAWYTNGEKRFTYATDNQALLSPRAVPYFISFYFKDPQQTLHRANINFDKEEIMRGFETLAKNNSHEPIELQISIKPDFSEIFAYLIKNGSKVELKKIKAAQQNLYTGSQRNKP